MQVIKARRSDLMAMLNNLPNVNNLKGFKLAYAVAKNKRALLDEQRILQDILKSSDKFLEYDKKRIELCELHAEKDERGKPMKEGGRYKGLADHTEFQNGLDALMEEYKEAIEAETNKLQDHQKALDEIVEFKMEMIPIDLVPQDITVAQMDAMMLMILDHDGLIEKKETEEPGQELVEP